MPYYIYILQCKKNGKYYIGSTKNIDDRLKRHNEGRSQYTKTGVPWELLYLEEYPDRKSAVNRENQIKRYKNREYIEKLIRTSL